jgi:non-heme chloroperoxidase
MMFLTDRGYRCIAHDRRGHGRFSQPWEGNEMNTYADDLAAPAEKYFRCQSIVEEVVR